MNPYLEMRRLMQPTPRSLIGTVISFSGSIVRVRIGSGIVDATRADATLYAPGDSVLVRDNIVKGRLKPLSSVPEYYV
jgi:hypothetical protein